MPLILIIEDEPAIADSICYALKTEGFAVTWKNLASEALLFLQQTPPDLIILDVGLPDMSGFDACREIRKTSQVPVVFLTAREGEIDRVVGLELGADDYVVKPFSPRELAARVRAILRRSSLAAKAIPTDHNSPDKISSVFSIDESRYLIAYHQQPLNLSVTEFKILNLLVCKPGRVYTRDQILDAAWDDPGASTDRTIDAHIKNIRAALRTAAPQAKDPIITHRGLGYSLSEDI